MQSLKRSAIHAQIDQRLVREKPGTTGEPSPRVGAASLPWYRPLVTLGGIALVATMTLRLLYGALANHRI